MLWHYSNCPSNIVMWPKFDISEREQGFEYQGYPIWGVACFKHQNLELVRYIALKKMTRTLRLGHIKGEEALSSKSHL